MLSALLWYFTITLIGWITFPLVYRLLPALVDRGYAFTRTVGLLLWAYAFWLLASLGILRNDLGGLLFSVLLLIALSGWALRSVSLEEMADWLRKQRSLVLVVEILFLVAFAFMGLVRAANPEILGTEKPMELAFINAILNSPEFPPHDPWLSGYAISYYYFGYVMVAMLAKLTGTPGGVAFNLGVTLVFALSAVGSYGLVYNLLSFRSTRLPRRQMESSGRAAQAKSTFLSLALLGPIFVLLIGNLEGFLEVLHARGLFWQSTPTGELTSPFWKWLDMRELSSPPQQPFSWTPSRYLWWWRASRVVQDYDFAENWKEVIDEFPAFSYLLADLHPHVLAMPFAFLAMGLALNLFLGGGEGRLSWLQRGLGERVESWLSLEINPPVFLLGAVCLGGLAFLNTWDFPFYVALFAGAFALVRMRQVGTGWGVGISEFFRLTIALVVTGIILYLPFYIGFSSQAGGVLPNLVYPTRGTHLWVMFAPLLLPLFAFLYFRWMHSSGLGFWKSGALALSLTLLLWLLSILLTVGIAMLPEVNNLFLGSLSAPDYGNLLAESLVRRIRSPGGWLTLLILLAMTLGLMLKAVGEKKIEENVEGSRALSNRESAQDVPQSLSPNIFVLLLILLGTLLVLGPEFLYLRDLFGWRINTIFKFYYQAWLLWAVAAAYASSILLLIPRRPWNLIYRGVLILIMMAGMTYTSLGLWTKTNAFKPAMGLTLDGTAYLLNQSPNEMSAIAWLSAAPAGVVAEAVGGSYSIYGRVSTLSGQPTVLGWDFHETQWRGSSLLLGTRQNDIQRLYCTRDWNEAQEIINLYNIRYIFLGNLERSDFTPANCPGGLNDVKFIRNLAVAFQQGEVTVYMVP
ncbi:MAG TPA: DUF2298 domain-containing protein [Anaerolineales bacterium]